MRLRPLGETTLHKIFALAVLLGSAAAAQAPATPELKLNQIQVIGTHNSYHAGLGPNMAKWLQQHNPKAFAGLDYQHPPLTDQLNHGIRQIELDIYADTGGGRYAHPAGAALLKQAGLPADPDPYPAGLLDKPGFKVFHVTDIDTRSTCQPFLACLAEVRTWSLAHPGHIPVFILVEAKQGEPNDPRLTTPEPFTPSVFDALDAEIRSVFPPAELITPDTVRGNYATLNEAVRAGHWPALNSARGKVVFLLDQRGNTPVYLEGHPSLRGRVLFTNATPGAPDAAFLERNDGPADEIRSLVQQGYLVRARTDADTRQARANDTSTRDTMIGSGAQILSTDYPADEPARWEGHFHVALPGNVAVRCDPVNTPVCPAALQP